MSFAMISGLQDVTLWWGKGSDVAKVIDKTRVKNLRYEQEDLPTFLALVGKYLSSLQQSCVGRRMINLRSSRAKFFHIQNSSSYQ